MRTSFHHQSEAQSPNGPLTAATSPDTPSPSPTTQSCANPEFPLFAEHPRFSAVWGGCNGPFAVSARNEDRPEADWVPSSLTSEIRFPVRGEDPARDSVRMRQRPVCMQPTPASAGPKLFLKPRRPPTTPAGPRTGVPTGASRISSFKAWSPFREEHRSRVAEADREMGHESGRWAMNK